MSASRDRTEEFRRLAKAATLPPRQATIALSAAAVARQRAYQRLGDDATPVARASALYHTRQAIDEARASGNRDSQLHFCTVEQMLLVLDSRAGAAQSQERAPQLGDVARRLGETERLFAVVIGMLERHNESIGAIERNVFGIETRVDASERELCDAAPRSYRGTVAASWYRRVLPRTTPAKARAMLALLIAFNLLLFFCGALG